MTLKITFTKPVRKEKILHHLKHVKKLCPVYRACNVEIDEANSKYILTEAVEKIHKECTFDFDGTKLTFTFKSKDKDLILLFHVYLVESLDEDAIIEYNGMTYIYDGSMFYLVDFARKRYIQMTREFEFRQDAPISRIPQALRICG